MAHQRMYQTQQQKQSDGLLQTGLVQRQTQESAKKSGPEIGLGVHPSSESRFRTNFVSDPSSRKQVTNLTGMPDQLKTGLEQLSGVDLSDVRVHYNSAKPAKFDALAYTQGQQIEMGPGQEQYLPHEGWHVVQQIQRRVQPMRQEQGKASNNDAALEHEADIMGTKAAQISHSSPNSSRLASRTLMPLRQQSRPISSFSAQGLRSEAGSSVIQFARTKQTHGSKNKSKRKRQDIPGTKPQNITIQITAPDSLILLYMRVQNEVKNYATWLRDDATWQGRSAAVQQGRAKAIQVLKAAEKQLKEAKEDYPDGKRLFKKWSRQEVLNYKKNNSKGIKDEVLKIRDTLAGIDDLVSEPSVPPKTWPNFMGDKNQINNYHYGSVGDPIPVVWYKQETHYDPIKIKGKSYVYPDGPEVQGRLKKYKIKVAPKFQFQVNKIYKNEKKQTKRTTQVDINYALKSAGANLNGLDGDHVTDLGFGGQDSESNYWPLAADVNRRPFYGWRSNYGINYISQAHMPKTAGLGSLAGKYLKIKAFMTKGDAAKVPQEGIKPEQKSGTTTL